MRLRVAVLGTLGATLTLLSAAFVFAPGLLLGIGPVADGVEVVAGTDPKVVMLGATVLVGLYLAVAARSTAAETALEPVSDAERRFEDASTNPPEAVTADRRQPTAAGLDADVEAAIEDGDGPLERVRDVLFQTAAGTYAEWARVDPGAARVAVESGTWTGDPVAGAFLAGEAGPAPALSSRLRLWLAPERERERRIRRTVAAIRALEAERR